MQHAAVSNAFWHAASSVLCPISTVASTTSIVENMRPTNMLCLCRYVCFDIAIGSYTVHIALLCNTTQVCATLNGTYMSLLNAAH